MWFRIQVLKSSFECPLNEDVFGKILTHWIELVSGINMYMREYTYSVIKWHLQQDYKKKNPHEQTIPQWS